jgi:hypothetical protein
VFNNNEEQLKKFTNKAWKNILRLVNHSQFITTLLEDIPNENKLSIDLSNNNLKELLRR